LSTQNDFRILQRIIEYCEHVERARTTFGDTEEDFAGNRHYQFSCAFCIEQAGEGVKHLSNEARAMHVTDWKGISGFRNLIAHGYGNVALDFLWVVVKRTASACSPS
jgi:uncharacterized protein with HEPN domain